MSDDYEQPNFVISRTNQKEAKTLRCSQVSYNLKSFPLQILSSFYEAQPFFFSQVILLSLLTYFIYLARETLKEGFSVFVSVTVTSFCYENREDSTPSLSSHLQAETPEQRPRCALSLQVSAESPCAPGQVPATVCHAGICSLSNCSAGSSRAFGLIILCGQCSVTVKWLMKSNAVFSVKRQCGDYSPWFPEGS